MTPFIKKWKSYLVRYHEPSDRSWSGETPLGRLGWLSPCMRVLDIGCGVGHALNELKAQGKDVVGLDISPLNAAEAKSRFGIDVKIGDMHDLSFEDASIDGVLMWDVFEHSLAPLVVLWEIKRVLRSGGRALMYIPPINWQDHPVHTIVPSRAQMESILSKAGLTLNSVVEDPNVGLEYQITKP